MKLIHRMFAYRQETRQCDPVAMPGVEFRRIYQEEILAEHSLPIDVRLRQIERLQRFGASYCFGAIVESRLAAFAWLVPDHAMPRDVPHLLIGKPGEAELTCAETVPDYRGRGLYGFVMANIFAAARTDGIDHVYFKTFPSNKAALRTFAKIGAKQAGTIYYAYLPGLKNPIAWPRRF